MKKPAAIFGLILVVMVVFAWSKPDPLKPQDLNIVLTAASTSGVVCIVHVQEGMKTNRFRLASPTNHTISGINVVVQMVTEDPEQSATVECKFSNSSGPNGGPFKLDKHSGLKMTIGPGFIGTGARAELMNRNDFGLVVP